MGPGHRPGPIGLPAADPPPSSHGLPFRADIEGLRGVAVLLVVAFHAGLPGMAGGFLGVDVFFALSGYLIVGLLRREMLATGTISLAGFYARRVRRLLPGATAVLVGTLLLGAALEPPTRLVVTAESARSAALYVSNLRFWRASTDYFADAAATDPFLHTWSLAVEEQFYLVCPLVVLLALRGGASVRRLAWALGAVLVASWAASSWYAFRHQPTAFFQAPLRAWEFAAGALVALLPAERNPAANGRRDMRGRALAGWLGLTLVIGAAALLAPDAGFPGAAAAVPVGGTVLLLAAGSGTGERGVGRLLSAPPLLWIGRRSYAWYLWHWPILMLGAAAIPFAGTAARATLALGALGVACATYHLVEEPCRRPAGRWKSDRAALWLGLLLTVGAAAGAEGVRRWSLAASDAPAHRAFAAAAADAPRVYADGCNTPLASEAVRPCVYGNADPRRTVVLLGDSHAAHWFPALERIAQERGWRIVAVLKAGCVTADVRIRSRHFGRRFVECERWRGAALDSIRRWRPALVVLSNSSNHVRAIDAATGEPAAGARDWQLDGAEWEAGMTRTLAALQAMQVPAAVIRDTPWPGFDVPTCLARPAWLSGGDARCAVARDRALNGAAARAERRAVMRFAEHRFVDLSDALCGDLDCPAVVAGAIAYRDWNHLTGTLSAHLAAPLARALDEAGLPDALR